MNEQIKISEDLLREELTNRYNYLDILRDRQHLLGKISEDKEVLARANITLQKENEIYNNINLTFREDSRRKYIEVSNKYNELSERLKKYQNSLDRAVIRAPENGIIKTIYISTVGGVIKPGEVLADLVPLDDQLVVEVELLTFDVGYVSVGQRAKLKLSSSSLQKFGSIGGTILNISPDKFLRKSDSMPFFKVRIKPDKEAFENEFGIYELYPGVQVDSFIIIGHRTVLEYLIEPFYSKFVDSFQER